MSEEENKGKYGGKVERDNDLESDGGKKDRIGKSTKRGVRDVSRDGACVSHIVSSASY